MNRRQRGDSAQFTWRRNDYPQDESMLHRRQYDHKKHLSCFDKMRLSFVFRNMTVETMSSALFIQSTEIDLIRLVASTKVRLFIFIQLLVGSSFTKRNFLVLAPLER